MHLCLTIVKPLNGRYCAPLSGTMEFCLEVKTYKYMLGAEKMFAK